MNSFANSSSILYLRPWIPKTSLNIFQKEKIITVYIAQLKIDNMVFIGLNYNIILMD